MSIELTSQNDKKFKISNIAKICISLIMAASLLACSSNKVPTYRPIDKSSLDEIPHQSQVVVIAMQSLPTSKNGELVQKVGAFQLKGKVYEDDGHDVVIPRRAVLEGEYANDGVNCSIQWKKLYPDIVEYKKQRNDMLIKTVSSSTVSTCKAARGVKAGDRILVKFNPSPDFAN